MNKTGSRTAARLERATASWPALKRVIGDGRLDDLRFRLHIEDVKAQGIPAPGFGIAGWLPVGVVNGVDPVGERFGSATARACGLGEADLRQIRCPAGARKEAHRFHVHVYGRAV